MWFINNTLNPNFKSNRSVLVFNIFILLLSGGICFLVDWAIKCKPIIIVYTLYIFYSLEYIGFKLAENVFASLKILHVKA